MSVLRSQESFAAASFLGFEDKVVTTILFVRILYSGNKINDWFHCSIVLCFCGRWLMHLNQLERALNTGSGILRTVHPEYHSRGAICHNSTRIPKAIKE